MKVHILTKYSNELFKNCFIQNIAFTTKKIIVPKVLKRKGFCHGIQFRKF